MGGQQMVVTKKTCSYFQLLLFVTSALACRYSLLDDWDTAVRGENTYLLSGETLTLTCTLRLPCFTVGNVCFRLSHPHDNNNKVRTIPASNIRILNGTTAEMVINNLTTADEGVYICYLADTEYSDCTNLEELRRAGHFEITVELSPQKVENIKCVVYDWEVSLTCNWTHPVDYVDWSNIDVSLVYVPYGQDQYESSCPNLSSTNCTWDRETIPKASVIAMEVTVNNTRRNVAVSVIRDVDMSKIVKPSQVFNLTADTTLNRPGCFQLSWNHARIHRAKLYKISHLIPEEGNFTVLRDNLTETSYLTCGYLPYTYHSFSVECYPTSVYSGYWSEPVYVHEWSPMTAPDLGPQTTNGSFTSTECDGRLRNVTLMWKEVDLSARNGIIEGYQISLKQKRLVEVNAQKYSATIKLPCREKSEINISANNTGGYSLKPSVLIIPPDSVTVSDEMKSSFSVEIPESWSVNDERSSVRALWKMSESTRNIDITLFWCVGKPEQGCQSGLTWSKIPGNESQFDISLPNSNLDDKLFGISVPDARNGQASGIFWTKCIYDVKPDSLKLSSMKVVSAVESVTVSWVKLDCTYQTRTKVTQYIVKWCQTSQCNASNHIHMKNLSATESSYQVSSLKANVNYSFTVLPESSGIFGDEFTPWMKASLDLSTSSDFPRDVVAGVIGGVVCAAAVVVLVFYYYRKCKIGRENVMSIIEDTLPSYLDNVLVPNLGKSLKTPLVTPTVNTIQPNKTDTTEIVDGEITSHGSMEVPEHLMNYIRLAGKPSSSEEETVITNTFTEPSDLHKNETMAHFSESSDRQTNETLASISESTVCPESETSSSDEQSVMPSYMTLPGLKMNNYQDYYTTSVEREEL